MLTLILSQIFLSFVSYSVIAQRTFISHVCQDTFGNYTPNSAFQRNLNTFFSTISYDTSIDYGFYNFSIGNNIDIVNGIGLCRPDLSPADCRSCLSEGAQAIVLDCPTQKDAIGWYEKCMLRYSDRYIFDKKEISPWYPLHSPVLSRINNASFNSTASNLLAKLQAKAASGDSRRKFAAGEANVTSNFTIYALVQCTPDLGNFDCSDCLGSAIDTALTNYYGEQARVVFTSCNIRYENYLFYDRTSLMSFNSSPSPLPPPPPASFLPSSTGKRRKKLKLVIKIVLPITMFLLLLFTLGGWYILRRKRARKGLNSGKVRAIRNPESLQMSFETISTATGNFSRANKLGQGGFGAVYKGKLPDGQAIAVKRLAKNSGQGEEEFKNEAALVARLQHRNLVKFLGFCLEGEERLLIYELLPNKSLDYFLFDTVKRVHLDWATRFKIIGGIARGLLYLHEDSRLLVVHRDLKSGNILLDEEMNPKISDFGMARLFGVDQTQGDTNNIRGTYGYMPPEYLQQGHFSFKSDVFSFGVLLLEIISGHRVSSFYNSETGDSLLSFAWKNWLEGNPLSIVDSTMSAVNTVEVSRCINIALLCVQENMAHRPTMSSIVLMLNNHSITPRVPSRPAFLLEKDVNSDQTKSGTENNTQELDSNTTNEISLTEFDPR